MKLTKAKLVQNLLDAKQITAEHAVILLRNEPQEREYIIQPQYIPVYIQPQQPSLDPFWHSFPGTISSVECYSNPNQN